MMWSCVVVDVIHVINLHSRHIGSKMLEVFDPNLTEIYNVLINVLKS